MDTSLNDGPVRQVTLAELGYVDEEITAEPATQEHGRDLQFEVDLIGIPDEVFRQIRIVTALSRRVIIFYGPPGTGKTSLAEALAGHLSQTTPVIVTASSDWSSVELVGGYQIVGSGISFRPGLLLKHFDKAVIIDELNRCDIDKVLGPLFTFFSGKPSTLPYLVDPSLDSPTEIQILPEQFKADPAYSCYIPSPNWRLIGTMNTADKGSLYSMSFALMRRFAWIYVPAPDPQTFMTAYAPRAGVEVSNTVIKLPLARLWESINTFRPLGAAPFIDVLKSVKHEHDAYDLSVIKEEERESLVDALDLFIFPLLDGIDEQAATVLISVIAEILGVDATEDLYIRMAERVSMLS